ncbi:MAG: hypothetical protein GY756_08020 [bacterium]|nr:hypothetical protein [bacterium]
MIKKYAYIILTIIISWWPMMVIHEFGHIISVLIFGGKINKLILYSWKFTYTIRSGSLHPLIDLWAGPVIGVLIPLIFYLIARKLRVGFFWGMFSGFCLIANGIYIGIGWINKIGDTKEMINLGSPIYFMLIFSIVCTVSGLFIWHIEIKQVNKKLKIKK